MAYNLDKKIMNETKKELISKREEIRVENPLNVEMKKLVTPKTALKLKEIGYSGSSFYFLRKLGEGSFSIEYKVTESANPQSIKDFRRKWSEENEDLVTVPTVIQLVLDLDDIGVHVTPIWKDGKWCPYVNGHQIKTSYWFNTKWKVFQFTLEYAVQMLTEKLSYSSNRWIRGIFKGVPRYYSIETTVTVKEGVQVLHPIEKPVTNFKDLGFYPIKDISVDTLNWVYLSADFIDPYFERIKTIFHYDKKDPDKSHWTGAIDGKVINSTASPYVDRENLLIDLIHYSILK